MTSEVLSTISPKSHILFARSHANAAFDPPELPLGVGVHILGGNALAHLLARRETGHREIIREVGTDILTD